MAKSVFTSEYQTLLKLLKERREKASVTQEMVAGALDMTQSAVSKVERGERRLDIVELRRWCRVLGISFVGFVRDLDRRLGK